ncbi:hypothetical protein [Streptomyces sp. NBC_01789]|uniref:hypothetical protein n=1 Tax=Streptomyces sp. NBC_01789 TaxID=2975941 RepID=UPI002250C65A|nr:hypothetical protein [Streptomyces sp. NBC_01789]MCX4448156.1 hypothetical protein [Streptomyces sp. NBC_01789]
MLLELAGLQGRTGPSVTRRPWEDEAVEPPARPVRRRAMTVRIGKAVVAAVLAGGVLTGCGTAGGDEGKAVRPAPSSRTVPYDLYTHCGIDEARVGSTYFEAVSPLSDGSGNPPDGWGNPTQRGTMTLKPGGKAVFTDDAGHEVHFRARPGASTFKRICA